MAEEFEGQDLSEAVFWGVDLTTATLRDVNLTGARMKNVWLVDVDGLIDRLVVNGVDVTAYVNEHDPWYPLRGMLRPTDVAGLRAALDALDAAWAATINRARTLTDAQLHESVGGAWSFVQTQQHLVFGVDKWFSAPLLGQTTFHAIGLANTGSRDFGWPGPASISTPDRASTRCLPCATSRPHSCMPTSTASRRTTSPARSRSSRTAPCHSSNACTRYSRSPSSTTATQCETWSS